MAATAPSVKVGVSAPRVAAMAPGSQAALMPANVAQFSPNGPGVISAMATRSDISSAVIQWWALISLEMSGIMEKPPKLVKPIFTKLQ